MTKERRSHKRYVVRGLKARLRKKRLFGLLKSVPTSKEYPCLDISEGGIQFATKHSFNTPSRLLLDITIPTTRNNPIRIKAQVVWFKMSDDLSFSLVGVRFVSIGKQDYANLKRLIKTGGSEKDKIPSSIRAKMIKEDSLFVRL
jgi:hypothetical protein